MKSYGLTSHGEHFHSNRIKRGRGQAFPYSTAAEMNEKSENWSKFGRYIPQLNLGRSGGKSVNIGGYKKTGLSEKDASVSLEMRNNNPNDVRWVLKVEEKNPMTSRRQEGTSKKGSGSRTRGQLKKAS